MPGEGSLIRVGFIRSPRNLNFSPHTKADFEEGTPRSDPLAGTVMGPEVLTSGFCREKGEAHSASPGEGAT